MNINFPVLRDYTQKVLPLPNPSNSITINIKQETDSFSPSGIKTEVRVTGDPTFPNSEGISHYQIDYLLIAFDEIIQREINRNPDVVFNSRFQNFLQWVLEFRRIVLESRSSPDYTALSPSEALTGIPQVRKTYSCTTSAHPFTAKTADKLREEIRNGSFDPKIYQNYDILKGLGFKRAYIDPCPQPETSRLLADVVSKVENSYRLFSQADSNPSPQKDNFLNELQEQFYSTMTEINNQITNGDYATRYTVIETKLDDTVSLLFDLVAASNTEANIVRHYNQIDSFYDSLKYENSDVDPALIVPTDTVDLVERDTVQNDLKKSISKYSNMTNAGVIASTYGITTGTRTATNVNSLLSSLTNTITKNSNISNPTQSLLELTSTTIYRNELGEKLARYLDQSELDNEKRKQISNQEEYLNLIVTNRTIKGPGNSTAKSRLSRYEEFYPGLKYNQYGGNSNIYELKKKSTQKISLTQTGGRKIDIDQSIDSNRTARQTYQQLQSDIASSKNIFEQNNDITNKLYSIQNLDTRNQFLIEMMNIMIIYNTILAQDANKQTDISTDLRNLTANFKSTLKKLWETSQSKITPLTEQSENINRLLSNADLTTNQVQNIIGRLGVIKPDKKGRSIDELINQAGVLNYASQLADLYGVSNIGLISQNIHTIYSKPVSYQSTLSFDQLYRRLYKYYTSLKSLTNRISSGSENTSHIASDLNLIREYIGRVIDSNIEMANTFISETIDQIENFQVQIDTLQTVRTETRKTSRRLDDFQSFVKETDYKLNTRSGILTRVHNDLAQTAPNGQSILNIGFNQTALSDFYKQYVSDYLEPLTTASSNISKSSNLTRQMRRTESDLDTIESNNLELNVYANPIWINWDLTGISGPIRSRLSQLLNKFIDSDFRGNRRATNLAPLSRTILVFIDDLYGSVLPLFSNYYNRVQISPRLETIFSQFAAPVPDQIRAVLDLNASINNNQLESAPGLNYNSQIQLIQSVAKGAVSYVNLARIYSSANNVHQIDGNDHNLINNTINDYVINEQWVELVQYLRGLQNVTMDDARLTTDLTNFLDRDLVNSGYGVNSNGRILYSRDVITEMNNVVSSIVQLYYEALYRQYQIVNSLSLNIPNINSQTRSDLTNLNSLRSVIDQLNVFPTIDTLTNPSNILTPFVSQIGVVDSNKIFPYTYKTIYNFNPKDLHNQMNTKDPATDTPYLLESSNNSAIFNELYRYFQIFESAFRPAFDTVTRNVRMGSTLKNGSRPLDFNFNIISDNYEHYTNSFIYKTTGIITIRTTNGNPREYLLSADSFNDHVILDINGAYAYIPNVEHDIMDLSSNTVYYLVDTATEDYYSFQIKNISTGLTIAPYAEITDIDLLKINSIFLTMRSAFRYLSDLYPIVPIIANLDVEDPTTWNSRVSSNSVIATNRIQKKKDLLSVLSVLSDIESDLLDKQTYLTSLKPRRNIKILPIIITAVRNANPTSSKFNRIIDKNWIFARKLTNSWFSIYGYVITSTILNDTISKLITVLRLAGLFNSNTDLTDFIPYSTRITQYQSVLSSELRTERNRTDAQMKKYRVKPIFADPQTLQNIQFNNFYSNMGTPSTEIFILLSLSDQNVLDLPQAYQSITNYSNRLYDWYENLEPYLNREYIDRRTDVTLNPLTKTELTDQINNFTTSVITDFTTLFNSLGLNTISNVITNQINDFAHRVTTDGLNADAISPDPRTIPNRILNVNNQIIFSRENLNSPLDVENYKFLTNEIITNRNDGAVRDFFSLLLTDYYKIIFTQNNLQLNQLINQINQSVSDTKIFNFEAFNTVFNNFGTKYNLTDLLDNRQDWIDRPNLDTNAGHIKALLFTSDSYSNNRTQIDQIYDVLKNITENVKPNLVQLYESELNLYRDFDTMDVDLLDSISKSGNNLQDRVQLLRNLIDTMNLVMYNDRFKDYAFVDNTKMLNHLDNVIGNYETVWRMINQKIYDIVSKNNTHVLRLSQINNYIAFKSIINKYINNEAVVKKIYRRMSFGLIEYYYDVMDSILYCLESKTFEQMNRIESYLYQYHYIQLKRCHSLFRWLRREYQPFKQREDAARRKAGTPYTPILRHKIETLRTKRDVNAIFVEFQGLRRYLDDYSAVVMDKVQLHLRINDFKNTRYNDSIEANVRQRNYRGSYDFLLDSDPDSDLYRERYETGNLMFTNPADSNTLYVNFTLMNDIYQYSNPNQTKNFALHYNSIYNRMNPNPTGINFERIYNTLIYPDSDVISNYMSIAPNITTGKGTVIMTYGYSGVGKSASLFGRPADPTKPGVVPSNGILQATLDQFSGVEIYFRVFEIYGLGSQYNFYWNPSDSNPLCYPELSQMVIHHVIDASGNVLRSVDRIAFTNRKDILSYIMDLRNPKTGTQFYVNETDQSNLGGVNFGSYFDLDPINKPVNSSDYRIRNSTYVKIDEKQYRNFSGFVDTIENNRRNGLMIDKLLRHLIKQVKGTINNPESSRSILVYDFEINLDPKAQARDQIFVPFLIYDLPGKEDIYRTYVQTNTADSADPNRRARTFHDLNNDAGKERKSTYVTNPLLIPIFDNNAELMSDLLRNLSFESKNPYVLNGKNSKFTVQIESQIISKILDYRITNFNYQLRGDEYNYEENGANYRVLDLYTDPTQITSFRALLSKDNFKSSFYDNFDTAQDELIFFRGIIGPNPSITNGIINKEIATSELLILVCVVVIAYLISYQLYDVIVEIINIIVNPPNGSDSDADGGWSRSKIYAFFEAYYINENVIGLLQYLIKDVLAKPSSIALQDSINENINATVNKNYKTANRYRAIQNMFKINPNVPINDDYGLRVNTDLLNSKGDPLREIDISNFKTNNSVLPDGVFATEDTPISDALFRMNNVITFENRGNYDSNKIFRSGDSNFNCQQQGDANASLIINPKYAINKTESEIVRETNRPLLQDFIEPYEQKIAFYYVFYVVSNSQLELKAEEQIKLLNNSMPFISQIDPSAKKNRC